MKRMLKIAPIILAALVGFYFCFWVFTQVYTHYNPPIVQDGLQGSNNFMKPQWDTNSSVSASFQSFPAAIRGLILDVLSDNGVVDTKNFLPTITDIQRLSFSTPNDVSYDRNNEWGVFSEPSGGADVLNSYSDKIKQIIPNGQFHITLSNRIIDLDTSQPELIVIFPDFPPELCSAAISKVYKTTSGSWDIPSSDAPNLLTAPNIAEEANIKTIPTIDGWPYKDMVLGCFKDHDYTYYYYQVVFSF